VGFAKPNKGSPRKQRRTLREMSTGPLSNPNTSSYSAIHTILVTVFEGICKDKARNLGIKDSPSS
jgi:hypothetical protein